MELSDLDMQCFATGGSRQTEMPQLAAAFIQQAPLADTVQFGEGVNDRETELLGGAVGFGLCTAGRLGNDSVDDTQAQALPHAPDTSGSRGGDTGWCRAVEPAGGIERVFEH